MHILFDIAHPAHAHFFKNPAHILKQRGYRVSFSSRDKDVTLALLAELNIESHLLSSQGRGVGGLLAELLRRDRALYKLARAIKPDVMAAIGGTFVAHVGRLTGIPGLVFYDTENAKLQNLITYPFAHQVYVPRCYQAWLPRQHGRYAGYHELSYLHPDRFIPDREIAITNGLAERGETYLLRLVSWQANHDIGETGWSQTLLAQLVDKLRPLGKILISSESKLPDAYADLAYPGQVSALHHLMAHCRLVIGESATMASEAAVLGVPAIYAANTGRGYTDEQELRYRLVINIRELDWLKLSAAVDQSLAQPTEHWKAQRQRLLADCIDVATYVADQCERWAKIKGSG